MSSLAKPWLFADLLRAAEPNSIQQAKTTGTYNKRSLQFAMGTQKRMGQNLPGKVREALTEDVTFEQGVGGLDISGWGQDGLSCPSLESCLLWGFWNHLLLAGPRVLTVSMIEYHTKHWEKLGNLLKVEGSCCGSDVFQFWKEDNV